MVWLTAQIPVRSTWNGLHYLVDVSVGTPPQHFAVILDTGSPELLVFNQSYCASSANRYAVNRLPRFVQQGLRVLHGATPQMVALQLLRHDGLGHARTKVAARRALRRPAFVLRRRVDERHDLHRVRVTTPCRPGHTTSHRRSPVQNQPVNPPTHPPTHPPTPPRRRTQSFPLALRISGDG